MGLMLERGSAHSNSLWLATKLPASFFFGFLVLGAATLGWIAAGAGQTPAIGVFVNPMMKDLGLDRAAVSSAFFLGSIFAAVVQPLMGTFVDWVGVCVSTTTFLLLVSISCILMSFSNNGHSLTFALLCLRLFTNGGLVLSCQKSINLWFVKNRGLFMGVSSALASLFNVGIIPWLAHNQLAEHSWRQVFRIISIFELSIIPLILVFIREAPETYGLLPDGVGNSQALRLSVGVVLQKKKRRKQRGEKENNGDRELLMMSANEFIDTKSMFDDPFSNSSDSLLSTDTTSTSLTTTSNSTISTITTTNTSLAAEDEFDDNNEFDDVGVDGVVGDVVVVNESVWTRGMAVQTVAFWAITLGLTAVYVNVSGLYFWLTQVLEEAELGEATLSGMYSCMAFSSILCGISSGYLLDRFPAHHMLTVALVLQIVSIVVFAQMRNAPALAVVGSLLMGAANSIANNVGAVTYAKYFGRKHVGSIGGTAASLMSIGSAIGPVPIGLLRDWFGSFRFALFVCCSLPVAVMVFVLLCGAKPKQQTEESNVSFDNSNQKKI